MRKVIEPESVHRNGYNDKLEGIKGREQTHPIHFFNRMSKVFIFICFMLLLGGILFCVGEAEGNTTSGWESKKSVVRGTESIYRDHATPSIPGNTSYYVKTPINTFTTIPGQDHVYVNPGASIQDAIDTLLPEGGTVELLPGVHNVSDTIVISRSNVTIRGTHDSEIRRHGSSNDVFVIPHKNPGPSEPWGTMTKVENLVFKGFKVTSTDTPGGSIVHAWNVNNLTVEDILDEAHLRIITVNPTGGGTTARSKDIFIKNNTIYYCNVAIYHSENIHVLNNTLEGSSAYVGIFRSTNYLYAIGNRVNNHGGGYSCLITEASYSEIYDNVFEGNREGIRISGYPSNIIVKNNTIRGATDSGILLRIQGGLRNISITNNRVYNNEGHGILTADYGYGLVGVGDATITNNVIYNNSGDGVRMTTEWINLTTSNNIITNNTGYGINHIIGNISHSYNDVWGNTLGSYNNTTAGTGDISANPLFADSDNGDFHLKSTGGHWNGSTWMYDDVISPCIDAGDPASDYSNEPEQNGGRINIGAYGNTAEASKSPPPALYHNSRGKYKFLNGLLYSNCLYITSDNIVYFIGNKEEKGVK
jgi:parallel beta-helix repeat protein